MSFTEPEDMEYVDDSGTSEYLNRYSREIIKAS